MIDTKKKSFEFWAECLRMNLDRLDDSDKYQDEITEAAWGGWQGAMFFHIVTKTEMQYECPTCKKTAGRSR